MIHANIQKALAGLSLSALAVGLVACGSMDEGSSGKSTDHSAAKSAKPATKGKAPAIQGDPTRRGKDSATKIEDLPEALPPSVPVQAPQRMRNGLTILPVAGGPKEIASIRLTVEAGTPLDPKGKSGLARLCANCLIELGNEAEQGEPLADRLARLSAKLRIHMAGRRAGFEISGPRRHLLDMVRILFELMTGEPPEPAVVAQEKQRLLHRLSQTREQRLRLWQIQRCQGLFPPTPKEEEDQLALLQAGIVQLFYTSYYRPQSALLSVEAHDFDKEDAAIIQKMMSPWRKGPSLPDPVPQGKLSPVNYTPWEGPGSEIILILPDPDPAFVGHGAGAVTWQVATLDGYGGWIGERLAAEGLTDVPVRVESLVFDRLRLRTLSYHVETSLVPKLLQTLGEAFAVLGSEEPSGKAFRTAVGRARLAWDLRMATPEGRIDALDLAYPTESDADLDQRVLQSFGKLKPRAYPSAGSAWSAPQILIRGPKDARPGGARLIPLPKEGARPVTVHEKVKRLALDPEESAKRAASAYVLAQDSIAGADSLKAFGKAGYVANVQFVSSIPFSDTWSYDMAKGFVERRRVILSTEIRTFTEKDEASGEVEIIEVVGGKRRVLDRGESEWFRVESVSQPHALLATMLRQKIVPKLGGQMESAGRSFLALDFQLFGQKLRLLVDEKNGLPRRLIYPEWRKGRRSRTVTLLYEAYDKDGRFQLPRRISKYIDGEFRGEFRLSYPRRNK